MSHVAVRIVADWLDGATHGINALKDDADFPLLSGDTAPADVSVYNDTEDGWVARRQVPEADDATAGIAFPLVIVVGEDGTFDPGLAEPSDSGVIGEGSVDVLVQLYLHDVDSANAMRDAMYLNRAIRDSLRLLDHAAQSAKTQCNTALFPSTQRRQPRAPALLGDLVCVGSTLVTYPVWEATPVTGL